MRRPLALLAASVAAAVPVALVACDRDPSAPARPTVRYVLDAPLCSSTLDVRFSIDGVEVGGDTFRVHLPPDHVESRRFVTAAGAHRVGAHVVGGYVWPDTTVTLAAGEAFADTLPFYCS